MTQINAAEVYALLTLDIEQAEKNLIVYVPNANTLDDVRYRALVNMSFNLGNRLGEFVHFLAAVNSANWIQAGIEMANSAWAKEVGDRAVRLRKMIETGSV